MSEVTVVSATQTFSENLEVMTEKEEFNIELRKLYSGRKNDCTKPEWTLERKSQMCSVQPKNARAKSIEFCAIQGATVH